ncbi:hypothetical protein [Hyalangium sp.]|uniref:hypothetical protein n=1 Tax=Hyalangium sp. TaxID=2028555 RepID=UPI002D6BE067|nr:hypothetical protein [Hyalangium sp.]HYH97345.1 hypothetical protein [Hyalangium sp.]
MNFTSTDAKAIATVKNNTILFSCDIRKPGAGGYSGSAVSLQGSANVTGNILAHSDNNGIYQTYKAEKSSVTHNVFFMNLYSNLKFGVDGRDTAIDDTNMDVFEEVGFKAYEGNEVKDPKFELDRAWMDKFSQRTSAQEGKVEMGDWNKLRQSLGLPLVGKGGSAATGAAPPWELGAALKLMAPKAAIKAGARRQKLEVQLSGGDVAAASTQSYRAVEPLEWSRSPASVDGQSLQMVIALGSVANITGIPSQYAAKDHVGIVLFDKEGKGERVTGYVKKGSSVQRAVNENTGYYSGSGVPDRLFLVKGTAHAVNNLPKAGFFIESIEPYSGDAGSGAAAKRVAGRDWFIREGASGGDGSREKPFKDPYQALEKVEAGDTVHVAEGEYVGKLRVGRWRIDTTTITLLGGYDKEFKSRNPWKHPTRLMTAADYKGSRGGYTIEGAEDHSGAVVDGFVFDKKFNNKYTAEGDLDYSRSDKTEHIWLARPGCVIRNNVFVNGAEGALRVASGQTVENNIFINHMVKTVNVEPGFGSAPFVFRNNTAAFAWDIRFGKGLGSNGNLLILGTRVRAIVDNNIFEFADNDAIRLNADAKDVELTRNVFSHNLWSNVQKPDGWVTVDDKTWAQLEDFGWKKAEGNQKASSGIPVNKTWFDTYLNRTAFVPGKVTMDDWNQFRELIGQPVIATGGKAGSGLAPAYEWKDAIRLFPKNPKVTAGARASDLGVKFEAVEKKEESQSYEEVSWDVAKSSGAWEKYEGKRVELTVVIRDRDNQYQLPDLKKEEWQAFTVFGPEGIDSGGLPMRAYVTRGSKAERAVQQAKSYSSGTPEQTYVIKGVVRNGRQLQVEAVERAD